MVYAPPNTTQAMARVGAPHGIAEEVRGEPAEFHCSARQASVFIDVARVLSLKLPSEMAKDQGRFPPRRDSPPSNCSTFGATFAQNDSLYSVVNFWDRTLEAIS